MISYTYIRCWRGCAGLHRLHDRHRAVPEHRPACRCGHPQQRRGAGPAAVGSRRDPSPRCSSPCRCCPGPAGPCMGHREPAPRPGCVCGGFRQPLGGYSELESDEGVSGEPSQSKPSALPLAGLWHPAVTSCNKLHSYLAGHCPNNSSLYPLLAAVVVVAPKGEPRAIPDLAASALCDVLPLPSGEVALRKQ